MKTGLKNQVVMITGASGGIGAACAEAFAAEGARLVLHANRNVRNVEKLVAKLETAALTVSADVTDKGAVKHMFQEVIDHFGAIDALVVNHGIWPAKPRPLWKLNLRQWNETLAVNLTGAFLCAREYFRYLERAQPGRASLVFVGSSAAIFGEADHADYAASKAAMVYGMTKSLKNEIVRLVPAGRVNAVCPAWTYTPMAEDALQDTDAVKRTLQTRAHKRIARPEDVANAIVYLSSPKLAGHVTGEILSVSGGMEGRLLHELDDVDPSEA